MSRFCFVKGPTTSSINVSSGPSIPKVLGTITITWYKFFGLPSGFIGTFGKYYGLYIWGDADYDGCPLRRLGCIDRIYIGQCGGGSRREGENKTGGDYKKGSFGARYRPGSYTNFPDAEDTSIFDNGQGIKWSRPKYFGVVEEGERPYIKDAEAKIINIYAKWIRDKKNVELVNNSIPPNSSINITHIGATVATDIPFLLQIVPSAACIQPASSVVVS